MKARRIKARTLLKRASVVHVEPGDLVVLQLPSEPSSEEAHLARSTLRRMFAPSEADVLVVGPGVSLKVIRQRDRGAPDLRPAADAQGQ